MKTFYAEAFLFFLLSSALGTFSWFLAKDVHVGGEFIDFWRGMFAIVTLVGCIVSAIASGFCAFLRAE